MKKVASLALVAIAALALTVGAGANVRPKGTITVSPNPTVGQTVIITGCGFGPHTYTLVYGPSSTKFDGRTGPGGCKQLVAFVPDVEGVWVVNIYDNTGPPSQDGKSLQIETLTVAPA